MSDLIYLDNHIIVCAKHAGEAVASRRRGEPTVITSWRATLGEPTIQSAHRIDQPVSGLLTLVRTKRAAAFYHAAFRDAAVLRHYLAVVAAPPEHDEDTLVDHLSEDSARNRTVVNPAGKRAALHYRVVGATDHHTVLLVTLESGRHHQIRAQLGARGWYVVGDAKYGARRPMKDRSIALHAWHLQLPHPELSMPLSLFAPLPDTPLWRAVQPPRLPSDYA